ncbi:MAG: TonB-dependent receptor plug domain-containing protein [Bacteroidota bacterium]
MRHTLIISFFIFLAAASFAQTRVVYGKLTAFNQYPLQNVEVIARKAKSAVKTDSLGRFSIVAKEKDVIKIKPKAFKPVTRRINEKTDTLEVNLVFVDSKSNRQMATGYGYIDEKDLNYAVSHLEQENNEFCNYTNIFELIRGRFPGVTVNTTQAGGSVYVRGATSINLSSEALYVVDGSVTQNIDWIHPCDVRSINVLKDGMTAIYGSRGANGVVVIETKR